MTAKILFTLGVVGVCYPLIAAAMDVIQTVSFTLPY